MLQLERLFSKILRFKMKTQLFSSQELLLLLGIVNFDKLNERMSESYARLVKYFGARSRYKNILSLEFNSESRIFLILVQAEDDSTFRYSNTKQTTHLIEYGVQNIDLVINSEGLSLFELILEKLVTTP